METEVKVRTDEPAKPVVKSVKRGGSERMPWQRLALSVLGIGIVVMKWRWSVFHIYSLPHESYATFSSITTNSDYVIGAIVIFMITGKIFMDWKNSTTSTIVEQAEHLFEKKDEKIEHVITTRTEGGAKAFDDES